MPYYVLKMAEAPIEDTRKKVDGKPLRQAYKLPFLSSSMSEMKSTQECCYLYEAQVRNRQGLSAFWLKAFHEF
jgi:hypothetical protein